MIQHETKFWHRSAKVKGMLSATDLKAMLFRKLAALVQIHRTTLANFPSRENISVMPAAG